jgi:methylglutaconyl-CoA hydratase
VQPLPPFKALRLSRDEAVLTLTLARPEARNAFNAALIDELATACAWIAAAAADLNPPRVLVLAAEGEYFSAGADLAWMRAQGGADYEANLADALRLTEMLQALDTLPLPVLARVQGGAFGGGAGLLACCDAVVCAEGALFGFSEVRLGLAPATIGPFVLAKLGAAACRELFLSGARFTAQRAYELGLVHDVVPAENLDLVVQRRCAEYLAGSPAAIAASKRLVADLTALGDDSADVRRMTARLIAQLRQSDEGREGLNAFLEKRKPAWDVSS